METMVIVSVLTTLCVGAIIASLVIAYMKLNRKVDVTEHDNDVLDVRRRINEDMKMIFDLIDSNVRTLNSDIESLHRRVDDAKNHQDKIGEELRSLIDSRCDKLDNKIKKSNKTLLND
jgi:peptidoglycan hydrolase CwlO-like protein